MKMGKGVWRKEVHLIVFQNLGWRNLQEIHPTSHLLDKETKGTRFCLYLSVKAVSAEVTNIPTCQ